MARKAAGTFTIWYLPVPRTNSSADDEYLHGITATGKADLMNQAKAKCPPGMEIKSITWQYGGSWNIWFRVASRPEKDCWDHNRVLRAFPNS